MASVAQRRAANIRERRRMFNLNEAFDKLRRKVIFLLSTELSQFKKLIHFAFYTNRSQHLLMRNAYRELKHCDWPLPILVLCQNYWLVHLRMSQTVIMKFIRHQHHIIIIITITFIRRQSNEILLRHTIINS